MRTALLALALTATCLPSLSAQNPPDLAGHWTRPGGVSPNGTVRVSPTLEIVQEGVNIVMTFRGEIGGRRVQSYRVGAAETSSAGKWKAYVKEGALVIEESASLNGAEHLYSWESVVLSNPHLIGAIEPIQGSSVRPQLTQPPIKTIYRVSPDRTTLEVNRGVFGTVTLRYTRTASAER